MQLTGCDLMTEETQSDSRVDNHHKKKNYPLQMKAPNQKHADLREVQKVLLP